MTAAPAPTATTAERQGERTWRVSDADLACRIATASTELTLDLRDCRALLAKSLAERDAAFAAGAEAMREQAARVADTFTCGACGMDGKPAAAIRALPLPVPANKTGGERTCL